MPNGAVVAAPAHQEYYSKESKSYLFVWPGRDLGFVLAAMLLIGEDQYAKALKWIWERAEDFQVSKDKTHEGLLFRDYHVNGRIHLHYFQPDQNGTLLWSIGFRRERTGKPLTSLEKKIVKKAADALARIWNKGRFTLPIEDLWEERGAKPAGGVLTYSLASCVIGLETAYNLIGDKKYLKTSQEMKSVLNKHCWSEKDGFLPRRFGGLNGCDHVIDASLSGLVWPFNAGIKEDYLKKTVAYIEKKLLSDEGVHRYEHDRYEGSQGDWHNRKNRQAGAWPLLTFWLSIAYSELGDRKKAEKYFNLVFKNIKNDYYIPEQLFCCNVPWTGVKPLLWSNAMAIFAAWKLGKL